MKIYRCCSYEEIVSLLDSENQEIYNLNSVIGFGFSKDKDVAKNWLYQGLDYREGEDDIFIITILTEFLEKSQYIEFVYNVNWMINHPAIFEYIFASGINAFRSEDELVEMIDKALPSFEGEQEVLVENYKMRDGLIYQIDSTNKEKLKILEDKYYSQYYSSVIFGTITRK
jgi:hypothetical protein